MREELNFNYGWIFHEGELPQKESAYKNQMYLSAKTVRMLAGPASMSYNPDIDGCNPDNWVRVTLPHDYIITQEPKKENNNTLGFFEYKNAWYRKSFRLPAADADKRITILFEGAATDAIVYVNGCRMLHNFCGYTSFEVDITDIARFGDDWHGDNVIAVYLSSESHEGWWYQGAGIYRNVYLRKTAMQSVELWGVFAKNRKLSDDIWHTDVETELRNDDFESENIVLSTKILNGNRETLLSAETEVQLEGKSSVIISQPFELENPDLWDIEKPDFYYVQTSIIRNGEEIDCVDTRYGYRSAVFDPENGFFLNGRAIKLNGVCCHQDWAFTGKAVPDNIQRYRLRLLKEMGANAYRCSHYPQHRATMDAFDELGFLVMAETRWFESTPEGKEQLSMLIRRDRNHPSVIMYSLGNEEPLFARPEGARILKSLYRYAKKLDDTRPYMMAVSHTPADAPVFEIADIIGVNYNLDAIDKLHEKYPHKPIISSENCAVSTTRGWIYEDNAEHGYHNVSDVTMSNWQICREDTWKFIASRPWLSGGFQWAGIEHRGESTWPRIASQSGALDLYLQKKDAYYQNMSHWSDKPMIHIAGHWNRPLSTGDEIDVIVYTNCSEAELILNGVSLGRKSVLPYTKLIWKVKYEAGTLEAVGFNGNEVVRDTQITTDRPIRLALSLENGNDISANGSDAAVIKCVCLDKNGLEVPDASPFVRIFTEGGAHILGTGSDISDHTSVSSPDRNMRAGIVTAALRVPPHNARIKVYAVADGLEGAKLTFDI